MTGSLLKYLWIILLLLAGFTFIYKLDYPYFFTDEILYTDAGNEYWHNDFSKNLQHPLLAKYIVGLVTLIGPSDVYQNSVFLLRLPFAIMGILSCLLIYKILYEEFDSQWLSFMGGVWYLILPFTYTATRMVMLEAPMHLFWLTFHYFFLKTLKTHEQKNYILAGLFMGLGLATKLPSITLYVFSAIVFVVWQRKQLKNFVSMYIVSFGVVGLTYAHFFLVERLNGIKTLVTTFSDVILKRNVEGKAHVIDSIVYEISPWWYYLYFVANKYNPFFLFASVGVVVTGVLEKYKFIYYWLLFFSIQIIFFQAIPLKAERYISSIELALPFIVAGVVMSLHKTYGKYIIWRLMLAIFVITTLASFTTTTYARTLQSPTGYHALRKYIESQTNNLTEFKKVYIFGSVRSSRWYKQNSLPDMFVFDKDLQSTCYEVSTFDYLFFDSDEIKQVRGNNPLYIYLKKEVKLNKAFEQVEVDGFYAFKRLPNTKLSVPNCTQDTW